MSIQKNKKITITAQGPFLHGTVTSYSNQCGKEGCHCKNDLDHRHGPYYRWGGKINGKYVSKTETINPDFQRFKVYAELALNKFDSIINAREWN